MRISFDIHGVIDQEPEYFAQLIRDIKEAGHEVYICTGSSQTPDVEEQLEEMGIEYDGFLSVVDYHKLKGTRIWYDEERNPYMDDEVWNRSKAIICLENSIDLHFDDSRVYEDYFETPYIQVANPCIIEDMELFRGTLTKKD